MLVGYARVSNSEYKIELQIELLKMEGCNIVYTDVARNVRENRPEINEMFKFLRKGDIVITYKNDRVFRSLHNMFVIINRFKENGVHYKSLCEPEFDTTSKNGKLL